jgi:hypothetical protein
MTNAVKVRVVTSKNKKNEKFFPEKARSENVLTRWLPQRFSNQKCEKRRLQHRGDQMMQSSKKLFLFTLVYFCVRETFFGRKSFYMNPVRNGRQS